MGICDPFFTRQASFEFTPTTSTITIEVQRDCESSGMIYIDNLHLQVATSAKLAFFYDDKGKRVSKQQHGEAYNQTTYYVRDASGNPMAIYNAPIGKGATIGRIEYAIYGSNRLGLRKARVDYGKKGNPIIANTYSYQLTDHLGNVRAVILKNGTDAISLTSKTDYYPFGMPMPNRNVEGDYRYKFQGQEKDPETGKEAFELRLWDARIGRWLTTDPAGEFHSPYIGMGNNPIVIVDPDGGVIRWASYRDVRRNKDMKGQFKSRSEYRKANRLLKSRYKKLINSSKTAKGIFGEIDKNDKIYTIYAAKSYGGGGTRHKEGTIIVGVNEQNLHNNADSQEVNSMSILAHEGAHAWLHLIGEEEEDISKSYPDMYKSTKQEVDNYNNLKITTERKASFVENIINNEMISNGIEGLRLNELYNLNLLKFNGLQNLFRFTPFNTNLNLKNDDYSKILSPRHF